MTRHDSVASVAAAILEFRRVRHEILPAEMFAEPAWDLMLELFVADAKGYRLTGEDVCRRCNVAPGVLSRWLMYLSKSGFVVGDGTGDLADPLTLSGKGMESIERAMVRAHDLQISSK